MNASLARTQLRDPIRSHKRTSAEGQAEKKEISSRSGVKPCRVSYRELVSFIWFTFTLSREHTNDGFRSPQLTRRKKEKRGKKRKEKKNLLDTLRVSAAILQIITQRCEYDR